MIENTFGILASRYFTYKAHCITCYTISYRWRIFRHPIIANPDNVVSYTKAAITLHNFLRCTEPGIYCPSGFLDGEDGEGNFIRGSWRQDDEPLGIQPVGMTSSNRYIFKYISVCIIVVVHFMQVLTICS